MHFSRRFLISLLLIPQYLFVQFLKQHPDTIEKYYTFGLYPYLAKFMQTVFSWLPFSVGDLLYIILFLILAYRIYKYRFEWRINPLKQSLIITQWLSVAYFLFHVMWGLNYYRPPLHQTFKIDTSYSTESLLKTTQLLTTISNDLHSQLSLNDTLEITIDTDRKQLFKTTHKGYEAISQKNIIKLPYHPKIVKASLFSLPLTYMGFSGYLNPFTHEAQVDHLIPVFNTPLTACHEMAHQMGYAAENEANFVGFLAAINHPDPLFNLSGYAFALRYCLSELYYRDEAQFDLALSAINPGLLKHFKAQTLFWANYKNPLEPLFKRTYNSYLKANNQSKGIASYNEVVGLIINFLAPEN